jgi:cyclohexa-1,5-dienecarbonyl-CoA hydratase
LEVEAPVATLTLAKAPLNVLDIGMMDEINNALEQIRDRDDISILVLKGDGKCFSAGADINDHTPDRIEQMLGTFHRIFKTIATWDIVTVASVHGHCLGGGAELAVAADFVIAADTARIGCPEIEVGCFPPVAAALFPELVGPREAYTLITTGKILSGTQAANIGLITRAVPEDEIEAQTRAMVETLAGKSPSVLRLTRRAIERGRFDFVKALDENEAIYLDELAKTQDMMEGLTAFTEKRTPQWTGS